MSIERQRRVLELLDELLELTPDRRADRLGEIAEHDPELAEEVRTLLEMEAPDGLLDGPAFDIHVEDDPALGRRIGDYELVELLGRGGMGMVYLGRRESFEQRVAIKIIRRGLDLDPVLVQRFENERAILARLEHPGIARLLDGGTADGLPYVVMEYVEGEPIDVYCQRRGLRVRQRLELFCRVLEAVQYAHRNLIVHRDLKPGNILVTSDDEGAWQGHQPTRASGDDVADEAGESEALASAPGGAPGTVKLLDFGIAKLLDESLAASPLHTATGEAPMTPRYASPEQIRRQPITTASDVYVLGVLLFELLTDLDAYGPDTGDPTLLSRAVLDREPERPSTAVHRRGDDLPAAEARRLRRRLAGDLDAIVLKAMRKEPGERYGSVEQLAEDIRRHLDGEPVRARQGTFAYRASKFVRRHRVGLAVTGLIFAVLVTAVIVSTRALREAEEAEERSRRLAEDMGRLITSSDFSGDTEELDSEGLEQDDLIKRADLARRLGLAWYRSGNFPRARSTLLMAAAWAEKTGDPVEVARSLNNYFALLIESEEYEKAVDLYRELIDELEAVRPELTRANRESCKAPKSWVVLFRSKSNLARTLKDRGDFEEAEQLYRAVLEERKEIYFPCFGEDDEDVATSRHNVASVLYERNTSRDLESALEFAGLALTARELDTEPTRAERIPSTRDLYGRILIALDRSPEAAEGLERALTERTRLFGRYDHRTAETQRHLAEALLDSDPGRAEKLLETALATFERRPGKWRQADARNVLELLRARQGDDVDPSAAEKAHRQIAEVRGEESTVARRARARWLEIQDLVR